ncbi:secretion protein HylD [Mesorhizobium sp. Root157]|uniref:efflux RND transporter periplasmic adaptor subunit n=1 Tax=Mesorhizobium sp. Root157 TaxID=1736477 RepID=UPI0006F24B89|nr:efflux RND transporter periplasmic adaptor subunit [Mesorhizobium sp. Root157]KQZ97798.1 secretion protein HylD [Mesorhizobium sp. Root157]
MTAWKQLVLALVILVAAAAAWVRFFPGAPEVLARWGIEWAHASTPATETGSIRRNAQGAGEHQKVIVVTAPATAATINDRLQAIGTGRAKATVGVTPYGSGRLTEVLVQSGAHVAKDQIIAKLDSATEEIAVERARAERDDAVAKAERMRQLRASNAATQVQLTDAELAQRNAELSLHDAEVALERRSITSPISGIVGILPIEAGNYVTSQSSIATIDDRSSILVDFYVPERFAPAINIGAPITATPLANPDNRYDGAVSAIDNRIDEKSRTLWVQATIDNPSDSLRAGMAFQIGMQFAGNTYPAVSPLAVQWGTDGAFIWTVEGGKAKRVPVRIIQRNTENVLVDGPVKAGAIVVTEGVQSVREGSGVSIAASGEPQAAEAGGS